MTNILSKTCFGLIVALLIVLPSRAEQPNANAISNPSKSQSKPLVDGLTLDIIKQLFHEHGLIYIDGEKIPAKLKTAGWSSETYQKKASDGFAVIHLVYALNENGVKICVCDPKMAISVITTISEDGVTHGRIGKVETIPCKPDPKYAQIIESIQTAQNHSQ